MKKIFGILVFVLVISIAFATTIYDIQYTTEAGPDGTYPSLYLGQEVTTTGIVTVTGISSYEDNFIISMPDGGEWSALYVYMANTINTTNPVVSVGDEVEITGYIDEYNGYTEVSGYDYEVTVSISSSGNPVPSIIDVTADVLTTGEQYESVLVRVNDITCIQGIDDYGTWLGNDGTQICAFDDSYLYWDNWVPEFTAEVGDTFEAIQGFVTCYFDDYRVNPRGWDDINPVVSTNENTVDITSEFVGCDPNPFNPQTTAYLNLKSDSRVTLCVYNIKGEKIRTLVNENLSAGEYHVVWNGTDDNNSQVSSGIYFFESGIENSGGDYTSIKKVILLK
ncbi:MAG: hypothetical protein PF570_04970 [Candidatus Cloacimonetes bacterium]|jgi:hypothetical protein|nr:hypothetical protein [Candidatus Cloacimonadota bacterium]